LGRIRHSVFYDENFQTLGVITEENEGKSVTVINPGEYKLSGEKDCVVTLTIITGKMKINGEEYGAYQTREVGIREQIVINTETVSIFLKETRGYRE